GGHAAIEEVLDCNEACVVRREEPRRSMRSLEIDEVAHTHGRAPERSDQNNRRFGVKGSAPHRLQRPGRVSWHLSKNRQVWGGVACQDAETPVRRGLIKARPTTVPASRIPTATLSHPKVWEEGS